MDRIHSIARVNVVNQPQAPGQRQRSAVNTNRIVSVNSFADERFESNINRVDCSHFICFISKKF